MRFFQCTIVFLSFINTTFAFNYQEHKLIGNTALWNTYNWLKKQPFFESQDALNTFLLEYLNIEVDSNSLTFSKLSSPPNKITYGDLNGLSGDHDQDPLTISENLKYRFSILNRIVLIQNEFGGRFYTNAQDKLLFKTDNNYGFLALINYNHFYHYGEPLRRHIESVEKKNILDLMQPQHLDEVIQKLNRSQSLNTYITLHCAALLMAEQAGEYYRFNEKEKCEAYLFYAVLFNAFADHFIEDACAAGHLVVNRSYLGSIINNKPLHDFYNAIGLNVVNMQGYVWKAFGDDHMLKEPSVRDTAHTYLYLDHANNETFTIATQAVTISLTEVFGRFIEFAVMNATPLSIPDDDVEIEIRERFYISNCKALQIIPLPFNSHLKYYFKDAAMVEKMEHYNWMLPYRNYVRRRVANTVLLDFGLAYNPDFSFSNTLYTNGLRFILSSRKYFYTDRTDKQGTFDHWRGTTLSYHINYNNPEGEVHEFRHQVQFGLYRCYDYWIGQRRFLNFHGFIETGIQINGAKLAPVITPSLGVELLPLFGFNRKPLPRGVSIPLQLILPVKLLLSYQMVSSQRPQWVLSNQVDIVF